MTGFPGPLVRGGLGAASLLATVTGTLVAIGGPQVIPGGTPTTASKDSVMRFYAVWWASRGPALWRLSRDPALPQSEFRAVCTTTFLGGLARLAAAKHSRRPHPLFQALTVAELALPPLLIAAHSTWHN